ncbi:restriction endonuclease [Steroidobacter flavus]|uniref:Restriction endonuclease n=1 Tax=Steroidobacter flavus TaxID=1842136 RepID=A0ABV8SXC0_9GAMM
MHDSMLFLPRDESILGKAHRLRWGVCPEEELRNYPWLTVFDEEAPQNPLEIDELSTGIGFAVRYSKRHRETAVGRVPVNSFIADGVLDAINDDPQVLLALSKVGFEELIAELFARMGFAVDLLRSTKDDGMDFMAVWDDERSDPIVLAVQTKHPDRRSSGRKRTTLSVATVREIYGVAKAWNLAGAVAITSSAYSPEAKRFAEMKPAEISLASRQDVLEWIRRYRWNRDE